MFKIITDGKVVDLLRKVVYLRFLTSSNKFVATDSTSAHAFYGSDSKTIYLLEGKNCPPVGYNINTARLVRISDEEFEDLYTTLEEGRKITADKLKLLNRVTFKINELSCACKSAIMNGISIRLEDGKIHKFELTLEDQMNLINIQQEIAAGARSVLYHEKDGAVRSFDAKTMTRIITAANKHKRYHTTYFNIMKQYVKTITDSDELESIQYGIPLSTLKLPSDLYKIAKENNIG